MRQRHIVDGTLDVCTVASGVAHVVRIDACCGCRTDVVHRVACACTTATSVRRACRRRRDDRLRRPRRRRRAVGRRGRVLARRARAPRARRREEAVPAREDVRRRPHPAGGAPAPRHGPRRAARRLPALRRAARRSATASTLELAWPEHPDFPSYGYVVRRRDLDEMVADARREGRRDALAGDRGARRRSSRTALVAGATVRRNDDRDRPRRCGPATSSSPTAPTPASAGRSAPPATARYPLGMAIRGYFTSPRHDDPWIESHLDIRDQDGNHLPGLRVDLPGRRRHGQRRRRAALDLHGLEERSTPPTSWTRSARPRPPRWGISPETATVRADRRPAPDRRVGRAARRPDVPGRRRRRGLGQPVQRRGHLGRVRDRPPGGRRGRPRADDRRRPRAARRTDDAPRRGVRPLLQGRPCVRAGDRQPRGDARAHPRRDAQPHAHGVGAADHGQPAAPRRDRSGRGRVPRGRRARTVAPEP